MKKTAPLLALLFTVCSCSYLEPINPFSQSSSEEPTELLATETQPVEDAASTAELEERSPAPERASSAERSSTVELLWQVPTEAVEKYHIHFGLDPAQLDNHIEIPVSELEKIDHPKHGPVYRYELKEIPAGRAIYLSLSAENKYGVSDASTPTRVEPGQRTVTP